jgi:hypothetical protein
MVTAYDKAITALVMAVVGIANLLGFHWGVSQDAVTAVVSLVTPVIVLLIPNKTTTTGAKP